jgi:hypothetical protein
VGVGDLLVQGLHRRQRMVVEHAVLLDQRREGRNGQGGEVRADVAAQAEMPGMSPGWPCAAALSVEID